MPPAAREAPEEVIGDEGIEIGFELLDNANFFANEPDAVLRWLASPLRETRDPRISSRSRSAAHRLRLHVASSGASPRPRSCSEVVVKM